MKTEKLYTKKKSSPKVNIREQTFWRHLK